MKREAFKFWDLVHLILEILRYLSYSRWLLLAWLPTLTSTEHMRWPTRCAVSTNNSRKPRHWRPPTTTGNDSLACPSLMWVEEVCFVVDCFAVEWIRWLSGIELFSWFLILLLSKIVFDLPLTFCQCHVCWCPGFLCHQAISSHVIDFVQDFSGLLKSFCLQ